VLQLTLIDDNQCIMRLKILFWEDVSIRIKNNFVLKTHPSTWKKSEVKLFLEHFKKQVSEFRFANNIKPEGEVAISYDTFRRILIKKEYKGSDYTRDLFAQYLGEKSYLEYIQKLDDDNKSVPIKLNQNAKTRIYSMSIAVLMMILFSSLYSYLNFKEKSDCQKIGEVISKAISTEFEAYQSVPNTAPSLESLKEYFLVDHIAYKKIKKILHKETIRKWVLTNENNISSAELLTFKCNYIDSDLASVNTKEHWVIHWFDTNINEYAFLYDTINTQTYYLKKIEDKWKVSINEYDANKDRVFVKIFNDQNFDHSSSVDKVKKKVVQFMSCGDFQSALWWLTKCSENKAPQILKDVILLNGNLQRNIRRVNTNEMDISKYHSSNKDLGIKIFDLLEKI